MSGIIFLIFIVAFILSVILHEIAHGYVANHFGDDTARIMGRLSLNPLVHIDPVGSVLVPLMLYLSSAGFLFGWAKPVPVNPFRLKGGVVAYRWVTVAGVATNFVLAVVSALILKITSQYLGISGNNLGIIFFSSLMQVNLVLAIFNALPLPGFDGWNFLGTFGPVSRLVSRTQLANPLFMARYGLVVSLVLLFLFMPLISYIFALVYTFFIKFFGL
ncbi:MAG: site-2 protease family protein [Patescibacteria group bacterium]|jgi:Zn-dependent protease|nr:site-2 protease family protein [Patescibacteria group bacterium]